MYKVDGYSHNHDDGKQPKSRRPTLIAHGGFDSTLEELYASAAADEYKKKIVLNFWVNKHNIHPYFTPFFKGMFN